MRVPTPSHIGRLPGQPRIKASNFLNIRYIVIVYNLREVLDISLAQHVALLSRLVLQKPIFHSGKCAHFLYLLEGLDWRLVGGERDVSFCERIQSTLSINRRCNVLLHIILIVIRPEVFQVDDVSLGSIYRKLRSPLTQKYDRVVEASGYLYDSQVHDSAWVAFGEDRLPAIGFSRWWILARDLYWFVGQVGNLPRHLLIFDVAMAELAVVAAAEGVEVPVLADQQGMVAPACDLDRADVLLHVVVAVVVLVVGADLIEAELLLDFFSSLAAVDEVGGLRCQQICVIVDHHDA